MEKLTREQSIERLRVDSEYDPRLRAAFLVATQLANARSNEFEMITFADIASLAKVSQTDPGLISLVAALVGSYGVLDQHFLFIEGDYESEVDDATARDALRSKAICDPRTGELVAPAEDFLAPYFTPTSEFRDSDENAI